MNTADIITLPDTPHAEFTDPDAAVAKLESLYRDATQFLIAAFNDLAMGGAPKGRYRAFYPEIRLSARGSTRWIRGLASGMSQNPANMPPPSRALTCFAITCANRSRC